MGRALWPEWSLQVSRARPRCVPGPDLCLSRDGAAFIEALSLHFEIWLASEFHNILDSWTLYDRKPALLADPLGDRHHSEEVRQALRIWLRLRDRSGPDGRLCWVRDAVRESVLPDGVVGSVVQRWEALAEALDERLAGGPDCSGPIAAAVRDAVALGAAVPGAILLGLHHPAAGDPSPLLCRHLEAWGLRCDSLDPANDLVSMERRLLRRLLVEAGLAGFLWSGLRIVVIHLIVPGSCRSAEELEFLMEGEPRPVAGAWDHARAFWYHLEATEVHAKP